MFYVGTFFLIVIVITLHTKINPYFYLLKINICMFPLHDSTNMYKVICCISIQDRKNISDKKKFKSYEKCKRVYSLHI